MTEFEFLESDRIQKIRSIIEQYGEQNFYVSFSGGKDSTVLSYLIDIALPDNSIPRVFANTGIEYAETVKFVKELSQTDKRIVIIAPSKPIKQSLNEYGYPFKSKAFSEIMELAQRKGFEQKSVEKVFNSDNSNYFYCPQKLQFLRNYKDLKISDKCCKILKVEPLENWSLQNNRPYTITALMRSEGGRRKTTVCLAFKKDKLKKFNPFAAVPENFIDYLLCKYVIKVSPLYHEPYNFERTGCKGCPFNRNLQKDLDTLARYFPNERKQCEDIWGPVYDLYRKHHYRLYVEKDTFLNKGDINGK